MAWYSICGKKKNNCCISFLTTELVNRTVSKSDRSFCFIICSKISVYFFPVWAYLSKVSEV